MAETLKPGATNGALDRRGFFEASLRCAALGGLGILGVALAQRSAHNPEVCDSDGICRSCSGLSGCRLPQALSARTVLSGKKA